MGKLRAEKLAEDHVEWFTGAIKPLLKDFMIHGYKHGVECCAGDGVGNAEEIPDLSGAKFEPPTQENIAKKWSEQA